MAIVIKEIVVKTTVEKKKSEMETVVPKNLIVRLKEEILDEIKNQRPVIYNRKER